MRCVLADNLWRFKAYRGEKIVAINYANITNRLITGELWRKPTQQPLFHTINRI